MYDPSVFDNLKVVVEGGLYDLEREGQIRLLSREDLVDLASMGRKFRMGFRLYNEEASSVCVELSSDLADFASELAKMRLVEPGGPGCHVRIIYRVDNVAKSETDINPLSKLLYQMWSEDISIEHQFTVKNTITKETQMNHEGYSVTVTFLQKIDEQNMDELQGMLLNTAVSLKRLHSEIFRRNL